LANQVDSLVWAKVGSAENIPANRSNKDLNFFMASDILWFVIEWHFFHVVDIFLVNFDHPDKHPYKENHEDQQGDDGVDFYVLDRT
jgi:hypothetical protein